MKCEQWKPLLAGYLDGELTEDERGHFKSHLSHCSDCREDLHRLRELKEVTDQMKHENPPDAFWDRYWLGIYNRIERGLAWVLLCAGGVLLLGFGMWHLLHGFLLNPSEPLVLRLGTGIMVAGMVVLSASFIRERIRMWRHDPYKEIRR